MKHCSSRVIARAVRRKWWLPETITLFLALWVVPAYSQHNHAAGHDEYKDWASQKTGACCNDQDCGSVAEAEHRETETGPQVRIDGQWCPVLKQHYLVKGKSPDWSAAHACIRKPNAYYNPADPCERLLCYSPKGGF